MGKHRHTAPANRPLAALLALACMAGAAHADDAAPGRVADLRDQVEIAYRAGDAVALETARAGLLAAAEAGDGHAIYFAAYASLRQALLDTTGDDAARAALEDCIAKLRGYTAREPADGEARALLGSCYGLSTRYHRLAMVSRGLEARRHIAAARELAPASPWVVLQDGLADYATPRIFGGDRKAGIAKLERATALFASAMHDGSRVAAWGAAETWLQLADMYRDTGRSADAGRALERARSLAPVAGPRQLAAL